MFNNFTKKILVVLSLILVFACKNKEKDATAVIVGSEVNYPPFESYENGVMVGFDIDLINELGKRIGKKIVIKDMAFDTMLLALQNGKIDAAISCISITEERKKSLNFTQNYYSTSAVLVIRENEKSIRGVEDLRGKKVATQIGTTQDALVDELDNVENVKLKTGPELIVHLKSNKVDAALLDTSAAKKIIENNKGVKIVENVELDKSELGVAVNKADTQLLNELNKALTELKKEGFIDNLYKKYGM